jgi:hypothetical protein
MVYGAVHKGVLTNDSWSFEGVTNEKWYTGTVIVFHIFLCSSSASSDKIMSISATADSVVR